MTYLRYGMGPLIIFMISAGILFADSDLETLQAKYEQLLARIVEENDSKTADLNALYSKRLSKLLRKVKQEGNQDKVNAVTEELNYFEFGFLNKQNISNKAAQEFPDLYNLQILYRREVLKDDAEKEDKILDLVQQYDKALSQLAHTLAGQDKLVEAGKVRRKRDMFRDSPEFKSAQDTIAKRQKREAATAKQALALQGRQKTPPAKTGPAPSPIQRPPRIDITVRKGKKSKSIYWDDVREQLNFSVSISNKEMVRDFSGLKATFYALSKDMSRRHEYKLILKETFEFDLPRRETYVHKCQPLLQIYDDRGDWKHGLKYAGYVVVIRDENGEIIRSRSTKSSWLKHLEKLEAMHPDQYVDF